MRLLRVPENYSFIGQCDVFVREVMALVRLERNESAEQPRGLCFQPGRVATKPPLVDSPSF